MDLDDDDFGVPSQVPTRRKFLPKSTKPKIEPKQEPVPKPEPQEIEETLNKKEVEDKKPQGNTDSIPNGISYMELDTELPNLDSMNVDTIEEEKDYVVREIDVFFNPSVDINTQLYVMQYPLRPMWRPYELDERCEEVRVKPSSAQVEVDLSVDLDSKNYDEDCENNVRMSKQTLSSTWKSPCRTGYAIGVLKDNKLHLNPIHAVVQLRPSMGHLKSTGSSKKQTSSGVQSKLATSTEQDADAQECWVPLKYHGSRSDSSYKYLEKLVAEDSSPIHFSMSPYDYVNTLCPAQSANIIRPKDLLERIRSLPVPVEERLKKWLCEGGAPVHRFSVLKHLADDVSSEEVLGILKEHALLVQGLWVPKSNLVLPDGLNSSARDHVLFLFSKSPTLSFLELPERPNSNAGRILKGFLDIFAVERPKLKDYKFKWTTDVSFMRLYPNIVKEQQEVWEHYEKSTSKMPGIRSSINPGKATRPGPSQNYNNNVSTEDGISVGRKMSDETREALPKALEVIFKKHNICSFDLICRVLREMAISTNYVSKAVPRVFIAASFGPDAPRQEFEAVISQVAVNIHGVYVAKSSSKHPEYNPLRGVVIKLLLAGGPNAKLKKAEISNAAESELGRIIPPNEYNKVMTEICVSRGSVWELKKSDGNPN